MSITVLGEGLTPEDAAAYWKSKVPMTNKEAMALTEEARKRAFYAAGLAKLDQVNLIHGALLQALEQGQSVEDFKKNIAEIIQKAGWDGRRIETIFNTNMQTAYQAGRWKSIEKNKKRFPYLQYSSVIDNRTRASHAALHGIVYPVDHVFWNSHYPPNGFNCRCTAVQISKYYAEKEGLKIQNKMPGHLKYTDPKTGNEYTVTDLKPDIGFANNVGKDWGAEFTPQEIDTKKIKEINIAPKCPKGKSNFSSFYISGEDCTPPLLSLPAKNRIQVTEKDLLPANLKDEDYILAFMKEFGLNSINEHLWYQPTFLPLPMRIDKQLFIDKATGKYKSNKANRGQYMKILAQVIKNPYEVWRVPVLLSGKFTDTIRFIRVFDLENEPFGGFSVFNLIHAGRYWSGSTVFSPKNVNYLEKQRKGILLYRENGKGFMQ